MSNFPTSLDTDATLYVAKDNIATALNAPMAIGDTTAVVRNSTGWATNMIASIELEQCFVTGVAGNLVTLTRAFNGTAAVAHAAGKSFSNNVDAAYQQAAKAAILAIETALGANLSKIAISLPSISITAYDFSAQSPGGSLGIGANVVTLSAAPSGLAVGNYLYISGGTGTAEAVSITGWIPGTGQVIVTCANSHSGAWTIRSATAGIQEAIVVAGSAGGGTVVIPAGVFVMHAPIRVPYHAVHIVGAGGVPSGVTGTVLQRTEDYGNTMTVGPTGGIYDFAIQDVMFYHVINYAPGPPPTIVNQITVNTDSSHLEIIGSQGSRVEHCSFENGRYGLTIRGGAHFQIRHNVFHGLWDPANTNAQQTFANIRLLSTGASIPTNCVIESNYISGYLSASRNRTVGAATFAVTENVGPVYGIWAQSFENLQITGGIIEKAQTANIGFVNGGGYVARGANIANLQLDSAGLADVYFDNQGTASSFADITITGCTFNGEASTGLYAIYNPAHPTNVQSVFGLAVSGNNFESYPATLILLGGTVGASITGNSLRGYNAVQGYNGDYLQGAAVTIYGDSNDISITGNAIGGGSGGQLVGAAGGYTNYGVTLSGNLIPSGANAAWTVKGNTVLSLAAGNSLDLAYFDAAMPMAFGAHYYIASETGGNNAIAGNLNGAIALLAGLRVTVKIGHTLQAGANTFTYNGTVKNLKSSRNPVNNIAVAYVSGATITLLYDGTQWVDGSQ